MFVCITVLYEYRNSPRNDVFIVNTHVRIKIYREFNHCIIYITNEGRIMLELRNKSSKPECVGSFNMDWWILVFYTEPEARDKIY